MHLRIKQFLNGGRDGLVEEDTETLGESDIRFLAILENSSDIFLTVNTRAI